MILDRLCDREVRILFRKELRQLLHARAAIGTSAILPTLMLGAIPWLIGSATSHAPATQERPLPPEMQLGIVGDFGGNPHHIAGAMLPLFVALVGLLLPTITASHLLITERERRTLELLVALPVRIEQVLLAKLLATIAASSALAVPFLIADVIGLPLIGAARLDQVIALPVLLVAALTLSTAIALLMALLARDFRTANNVAGALLAPMIFATIVVSTLLPGGAARPLGIALVYVIVAMLVLRHALRSITFERLLS